MNMIEKRIARCLSILIALLLFAPNLEAKISSLSPWTFQERLPTSEGKIDQSAGFQFGVNGVSPSGADTDARFAGFPYQLTYGLMEKVEIGASWGLQWIDRREKSGQFGIADMTVAGRYRFFDADRASRNPGLDLEAGFSFPTASFEKGLGTGGLGILFGWGLVLPLDPVRAHFGMGFRLNTENSDSVKVGNVFSYNGGISYPMKQYKDEISLTGEIKGFNRSRNKRSGATEGPESDELYLAPGAGWKFRQKARLAASLLIGLTAQSSDIGLNLELQF
jgi:hypothetical protein